MYYLTNRIRCVLPSLRIKKNMKKPNSPKSANYTNETSLPLAAQQLSWAHMSTTQSTQLCPHHAGTNPRPHGNTGKTPQLPRVEVLRTQTKSPRANGKPSQQLPAPVHVLEGKAIHLGVPQGTPWPRSLYSKRWEFCSINYSASLSSTGCY